LSSIDGAASSALLANANPNVIRPASANEYQDSDSQYQKNFECFRKEDEFKQLLENLDIENIEIDLSIQARSSVERHHMRTKNEYKDEIEDDLKHEEINQDFNIEIEKLLEDDDEILANSEKTTTYQ